MDAINNHPALRAVQDRLDMVGREPDDSDPRDEVEGQTALPIDVPLHVAQTPYLFEPIYGTPEIGVMNPNAAMLLTVNDGRQYVCWEIRCE